MQMGVGRKRERERGKGGQKNGATVVHQKHIQIQLLSSGGISSNKGGQAIYSYTQLCQNMGMSVISYGSHVSLKLFNFSNTLDDEVVPPAETAASAT